MLELPVRKTSEYVVTAASLIIRMSPIKNICTFVFTRSQNLFWIKQLFPASVNVSFLEYLKAQKAAEEKAQKMSSNIGHAQ